jgi:hypothetical protein
VADAAALQSQPYDATEKSLTLVVTGCLACAAPPVIAGSPRLLVTKPPAAFEKSAAGPVPVGLDLSYHDVPQPTAARAASFKSKLASRLRVEFVFTVGPAFGGSSGGGVLFTPLAHRIFNRCSGEVIASEPVTKSPKVERDQIAERDPACPKPGAPTEEEEEAARKEAALPDSLTRGDIEKAMVPVQAHIYECGEEFELRGVAHVKFSVDGEGKTIRMSVLAPYDQGDPYLCLRAAFKEAKFPRFKSSSPPVNVDFPFVWRR